MIAYIPSDSNGTKVDNRNIETRESIQTHGDYAIYYWMITVSRKKEINQSIN